MCDVITYTVKWSTIIEEFSKYLRLDFSLSCFVVYWIYLASEVVVIFFSKRVFTSLFVQGNVFGCMKFLNAVKHE